MGTKVNNSRQAAEAGGESSRVEGVHAAQELAVFVVGLSFKLPNSVS